MGNMWGFTTYNGPPDMESPEAKFIQSQIADHCVVIFSKTYCPYCVKCKETFSHLNVNPHVIELNKRKDCATMQDILEDMTGARTVPRVFINGKSIGGNSETRVLYDSGKLAELVADCAS